MRGGECWDIIWDSDISPKEFEKVGDAVTANAALVGAVANGDLTPSEAGELAKLVDAYTRAVEATDIQDRLTKLEAAQVKR